MNQDIETVFAIVVADPDSTTSKLDSLGRSMASPTLIVAWGMAARAI